MTVAQDKLKGCASTQAARHQSGLTTHGKGLGSGIKNLVDLISYSLANAGNHNQTIAYGESSPQGDADYANMAIGSRFIQFEVTTTTVTGIVLWIKTGTATTSWKRIQIGNALIASGKVETAGGDETEVIAVTGLVSTDDVTVNVCSMGVASVKVNTYTWNAGLITVTLSADPGTDHALDYRTYRNN